ncbi:hypothetical protein NMG60_11035941 [Bertholletia excelsa]
MGNHRFSLADIIPNSWLYKLKEMGRRSTTQNTSYPRKKKHPPPVSSSSSSSSSSSFSSSNKQPNPLCRQRKSYYFTRELTSPRLQCPDPPRKSSKQSRQGINRRAREPDPPMPVATSVSAGCSCRSTTSESAYAKPDSTSEDYPNSPLCSSSDPESLLPEFGSDHEPAVETENDIVIDVDEKPVNPKLKVDGFDSIAELELELELPPIITHKLDRTQACKPTKSRKHSSELDEKNDHGSLNSREQRTSPVARGLRLRPKNSPRISCRRVRGGATPTTTRRRRRSLSESFAVVKASEDPQRDFRESMVEMIMENNIRTSKDLEDLLACYLQLNSDEHHAMIIRVFKQIWFDLAGSRLN